MVADVGLEVAVPVVPSVGVSPRWSASAFSMASSLVLGGVETSPSTWRPYSSHVANLSPA